MYSIDLFCGAGGLTCGLEDAGWTTVAAVEKSEEACATYRKMFPDVELISEDIKKVSFARFRGEVDLVAGGPPCQPFSTGGLGRGDQDMRDMLPEFVRAVGEVLPRVFLMENVLGLASEKHAGYLSSVYSPLAGHYRIFGPIQINAADYGVPQKRRRIVMVGVRNDISKSFTLPMPTDPVPVGTIISALGFGESNDSKVVYAKNPDLRPSPFDGQLFNGGGRPIDLTSQAPTILASAGGNKTPFVDTLNTVPSYHAHLRKGGKPRKGVLDGGRRLTPEECAAIQTFPADYVFCGSRSSKYTQIGNAVPPKLASMLGSSLLEVAA